jgi:hypothetical protein
LHVPTGSFTHVIKAAEPVVSVLLSLVVLGAVPKPLTAVSLLPITYGVAYASTLGDLNPATMAKELTTKAAQYDLPYVLCFFLKNLSDVCMYLVCYVCMYVCMSALTIEHKYEH